MLGKVLNMPLNCKMVQKKADLNILFTSVLDINDCICCHQFLSGNAKVVLRSLLLNSSISNAEMFEPPIYNLQHTSHCIG